MRDDKLILIGFGFGLTILACSLFSPQIVPKIESTPTPTVAVRVTETLAARPEPSSTFTVQSSPSATDTPPAATLTPTALSTLDVQQTQLAPTVAAQMKRLSGTLLSQCPDPSDPPQQNWVNIPVMPQATAGQVVKTLIGSYYCFRAPVSAAEVDDFYKQKLSAPTWTLESDVNGSMVFIGMGQAGFQYLFVVSGPGNKNDLIVALNVSIPIKMPTQKP